MAMDGFRGYLQLASGLAEMSKARATEAASALLTLTGGLSSARSGKDVQVQVQDLAEELLAAAAANRRSLIALIRSEVERAMAMAPIPPDELDRARAAVAKLSADVEELRAQVMANPAVGEVAAKLGLAGRTVSRPADPFAGEDDGVVVDVAFTEPAFTAAAEPPTPAPPRRRPPRKQFADQAATRPVPADATTDSNQAAVEPRTETGASTTPATTKAAATKRTAAKKTATTKTAAKKTAATKTATTKTAAKKSATKKTAKKTTATKTAAQKTAAKKGAAAKKTTTTKAATAKKATAKRAPRSGGAGGSSGSSA